MFIGHQTPLDLNVRVLVMDANGNKVQEHKFKNTATKRMTTGIAKFLAGDNATYENRTLKDAPASGLGRWRPNYISFGTAGIDKQPTSLDGAATVHDPVAFANKHPADGDRTRPWFFSKYLGERTDGLWNPLYGWGTEDDPDGINRTFQGELATASNKYDPDPNQKTIINRHQILRADVTNDNSWEREMGQEGYSTDCILYGYASVLWTSNFFEPEYGPAVPKIAISEFGLYESDSDTPEGVPTLMAGFRVPTVDDIVYVEPGYVILVEWRITIRALMPYEGVGDTYGDAPSGISVKALVLDTQHVQMDAIVHGSSLVSQAVNWSITGQQKVETTISSTGLLTIAQAEPTDAIYVRAECQLYPEIYAVSAVITGLIKDLVTGVTVSTVSVIEQEIQLRATVLGKGTFLNTVVWSMTGQQSEYTTIDQNGLITIDPDEEATALRVQATSVADSDIWSVAAVIRMDKDGGTYYVEDFSIETQGGT